MFFKAADLENIVTRKLLVTNISKCLFKYIIVVRNQNNLHIFCHLDIPTIHKGYCVSNAVDYAKRNDVLPTILSTELGVSNNRFLH